MAEMEEVKPPATEEDIAVDSEGAPDETPADEANGTNERQCRICLESDDEDTMIAPCRCKGSSKWVHRECLDMWRVHERDRAFSKCTECLFEYRLQAKKSSERWNKLRFYTFVGRDFILAMFLVQAVIIGLAAIVWLFDRNQALVDAFSSEGTCNEAPKEEYWCNHVLSAYYLVGAFGLLVILGLVGSVVVCTHGCSLQRSIESMDLAIDSGNHERTNDQEDRARYYRQYRRRATGRYRHRHHPSEYCYGDCFYIHVPVGDCHCDGCGSGCNFSGCDESDLCAVFLVVLVFVAIVMAVVGFMFGVLLAFVFCQRIVQNHLFFLRKKRLAREFVVKDLADCDLNEMQQDTEAQDYPHPSAPPASEDDITPNDRKSLRRLGLMDAVQKN